MGKKVYISHEELMSNPDTEWHYEFECEHEGDVRYEEDQLIDSEAVKDIRVEEDPHGDTDYYTTIYFKVTDYDKFEKFFECPVWEMASTYNDFYWANDDGSVMKPGWFPADKWDKMSDAEKLKFVMTRE